MPLTAKKLCKILICFLLVSASAQAAANSAVEEEYRYLSFDDAALPKKIDLSLEQKKLIGSLVFDKRGKFFDYRNYGAYATNERFVYVKLYLRIKEALLSEWISLQRQKSLSGEKRQQSHLYDLAVIDTEKAKAFFLGINYMPEDGVLRFIHHGCLNDRFAFEKDINKDGKKELFFIRGYEAGTDAYMSAFTHQKLYLLSDYKTLLFQEWLTNIDHEVIPLKEWIEGVDHETIPPNSPVSEYQYKKPYITGMAGSQARPDRYEIRYDDYEELVKEDRLGLKRFNSQFYFDYVDKEEKGISKQLVLVWSQIYRPSPDPKSRDFVITEERFKWYEGDVTKKTPFIEKPITEEAFKAFLDDYGLSFDDGLTEKRLCNM